MASLYHQQAISPSAKRLVVTNWVFLFDLSIKFFHIFLEIKCGLSNLICIFATSFAHDGLSASRAERLLRVKTIASAIYSEYREISQIERCSIMNKKARCSRDSVGMTYLIYYRYARTSRYKRRSSLRFFCVLRSLGITCKQTEDIVLVLN